ncbi:MAG: hypothetical protein ACRERU_17240 [Methylococcales bacterium]
MLGSLDRVFFKPFNPALEFSTAWLTRISTCSADGPFASVWIMTCFGENSGKMSSPASSQVPALLGLSKFACGTGAHKLTCVVDYLAASNPVTTALGGASLVLLVFFNGPLPSWLRRLKLRTAWVTGITKTGPLIVVIGTSFLVAESSP